jgi:hypothetical protein
MIEVAVHTTVKECCQSGLSQRGKNQDAGYTHGYAHACVAVLMQRQREAEFSQLWRLDILSKAVI